MEVSITDFTGGFLQRWRKGVTGYRAHGGFWKLHLNTLLLSQSPSLHLIPRFPLLAPHLQVPWLPFPSLCSSWHFPLGETKAKGPEHLMTQTVGWRSSWDSVVLQCPRRLTYTHKKLFIVVASGEEPRGWTCHFPLFGTINFFSRCALILCFKKIIILPSRPALNVAGPRQREQKEAPDHCLPSAPSLPAPDPASG